MLNSDNHQDDLGLELTSPLAAAVVESPAVAAVLLHAFRVLSAVAGADGNVPADVPYGELNQGETSP